MLNPRISRNDILTDYSYLKCNIAVQIEWRLDKKNRNIQKNITILRNNFHLHRSEQIFHPYLLIYIRLRVTRTSTKRNSRPRIVRFFQPSHNHPDKESAREFASIIYKVHLTFRVAPPFDFSFHPHKREQQRDTPFHHQCDEQRNQPQP